MTTPSPAYSVPALEGHFIWGRIKAGAWQTQIRQHTFSIKHSPEGNGPKLSILHGFQTLSGKARMSFNALGRANPGTTTSEKRQNNENDDVRKQLQCT
jgi:hypothetical protein